MAKLTAAERAALPDSAFAYVDGQGKRRLPIHDEPHVRNALARFNQVRFADDAARERARTRLLLAARRHGIVPVGFMASQLAAERRRAAVPELPTGLVTLMFTDIEGSTGLLQRLGARYPGVLAEVREIIAGEVDRRGGRSAEVRADETFTAFEAAVDAVAAAAAIRRELAARNWADETMVRVRIGIHSGETEMTRAGYVGLAVHAASRVCFAAHGGQILLTGATAELMGPRLPNGARLRDLGQHRFAGLIEPLSIFQVDDGDEPVTFPPLRTAEPAQE